MRIVGGEKKGFKLKTLKGLDVRPTLEHVKESVFNMLVHELEGATVADLFCGSGNLGLEALSRGAKHCVFVDANKDSLKITRDNVQALGYDDRVDLVRIKIPESLGKLKSIKDAMLVFADPPYGTNLAGQLLKVGAEKGIFRKDALIVVEHSGKTAIGFDNKEYTLLKQKKYGQTDVLILRKD